MLNLSQMSARKLLVEKGSLEARMSELEGLMARPGRGTDCSRSIAELDAKIREIDSELVCRTIAEEDRSATLPRRMIDALQASPSTRSQLSTMTVCELMEVRNDSVERRNKWRRFGTEKGDNFVEYFQSHINAIDAEIERRVLEAEDRRADHMEKGRLYFGSVNIPMP